VRQQQIDLAGLVAPKALQSRSQEFLHPEEQCPSGDPADLVEEGANH